MRRVVAVLGAQRLRLVGRSEAMSGELPSDGRDAWSARVRWALREVETPALVEALIEDGLSPSALRRDRASIEQLIADRLAHGGWRLATGDHVEHVRAMPPGQIVETEGEGEEVEHESFTASFYVDAEPRFFDAEILGEAESEDLESEIEGDAEPVIVESEITGELVPAGVRGWVEGGELAEEEEEAEEPQAMAMREAAEEGAPFCEECARAAAEAEAEAA